MTEEEQRLRDRVLAKRAEEDRWKSKIQAKMSSGGGGERGGEGRGEGGGGEEESRRNLGPDRDRRDRDRDRRRGGPRPRDYRRGPPPHHHHYHNHNYYGGGGGGPPVARRDDFGRQARPLPGPSRGGPPPRGRSYSRSFSRSRSRSYSNSSNTSGSGDSSRGSSRSRSRSASAGSHSSESSAEDKVYSKDQRTVFINQLVMKTNEYDLRHFFKSMNIKTRDVILLRDKRTGKHKGFAYVELKHMHDVNRALEMSEKVPDFQRFPILIKASEAEKNKVAAASSTTTISINNNNIQVLAPKKLPPVLDDNGNVLVTQKVYVGNLEVSQVTAQHLQALFAPFGTLEEIQLQTGKGFAFLQYRDPKEAALAIQSMSGQKLHGRNMKTGWATSNPHAVTATDFPPDATVRIQNAYAALASLTMGQSVTASMLTSVAVPAPCPPPGPPIIPGTVAEARMSLAAAANLPTMMAGAPTGSMPIPPPPPPPPPAAFLVPPPPPPPKKETFIMNADHPTNSVIIYNMFDKDQETEPGWPKEIELEFIDECAKYGPIARCIVAHREVGGKIYATFTSGAQSCATSLAGRWFDRRQLRVEYVDVAVVDDKAREYGM